MIDPASSWFEIVELPVAEISFTKKIKLIFDSLKSLKFN
jgi:hypothetical protein